MTNASPFTCLDGFEIFALIIVAFSIFSGVALTRSVIYGYKLTTVGELGKNVWKGCKRNFQECKSHCTKKTERSNNETETDEHTELASDNL